MPVNIEEIKKLPAEEKLKILDELLENIDQDIINEHFESEEDQILRERLAEYEKGEMKSYSWKEVEERIKKNLEQQRNEKK